MSSGEMKFEPYFVVELSPEPSGDPDRHPHQVMPQLAAWPLARPLCERTPTPQPHLSLHFVAFT